MYNFSNFYAHAYIILHSESLSAKRCMYTCSLLASLHLYIKCITCCEAVHVKRRNVYIVGKNNFVSSVRLSALRHVVLLWKAFTLRVMQWWSVCTVWRSVAFQILLWLTLGCELTCPVGHGLLCNLWLFVAQAIRQGALWHPNFPALQNFVHLLILYQEGCQCNNHFDI